MPSIDYMCSRIKNTHFIIQPLKLFQSYVKIFTNFEMIEWIEYIRYGCSILVLNRICLDLNTEIT